nr:hypothetical protein [Bacteroidota bacterium]
MIKKLLIFICILSSCINKSPETIQILNNTLDTSSTDKINNQTPKIRYSDDPNYVASFHLFDYSLDNFNIEGTKYEVVNRIAKLDSHYDFNETSISILLRIDGKVESELFKYSGFTTRDIKNGDIDKGFSRFCKVNYKEMFSETSRRLARFDFDYLPSAPGNNTITFVQFEKNTVKSSDYYHIDGRFETNGDTIKGIYWTGYFGVIVPLLLLDTENELNLIVDSLKINHIGKYLIFSVNDSIKTARETKKIEIVDDIFSAEPSFISVDIIENMEIRLSNIAIVDSTFTDFKKSKRIILSSRDTTLQDKFKNGQYWLKIRIGEKEGWTRSQQHYNLIGCDAAG